MTIWKIAMATALLGLGSMPATAQMADNSMSNSAASDKHMSTHKVTTTTHTTMHKSMSHHPMMMNWKACHRMSHARMMRNRQCRMMMKHHTVHHTVTHVTTHSK